ncbi:15506_t:CDS:2, partial [Dentiscutata heterogama]
SNSTKTFTSDQNDVAQIANIPLPPTSGIRGNPLFIGSDLCNNIPNSPPNNSIRIAIFRDNIACDVQKQIKSIAGISSGIIQGILLYSNNSNGTIPSDRLSVDIGAVIIPTFYVSQNVVNFIRSVDIDNSRVFIELFPMQKNITTTLQITFIGILFTFLIAFVIINYGLHRCRRRRLRFNNTIAMTNLTPTFLEKEVVETFPVKKFIESNINEHSVVNIDVTNNNVILRSNINHKDIKSTPRISVSQEKLTDDEESSKTQNIKSSSASDKHVGDINKTQNSSEITDDLVSSVSHDDQKVVTSMTVPVESTSTEGTEKEIPSESSTSIHTSIDKKA